MLIWIIPLFLSSTIVVIGIVFAFRRGSLAVSSKATRIEKNKRHLITLGTATITALTCAGFHNLNVLGGYGWIVIAVVMSGVLILRCLFVELGIRRIETKQT